ncbi:MAG: hypothetical protein H6732_09100 [Alphaproteobacteria bacterium]|nr:hypothetical protein [Alphaproteobacteria bacterium]
MWSSPPAVTGFVAYVGALALLGEVFPLSHVGMYAELGAADRHESAVPVVLVGGQRAAIEAFDRFRGPDPHDIEPWDRCRAVGPCGAIPSDDPRDADIARWVREHLAPEDEEDGPDEIEVAYVRIRPEGAEGFSQTTEVVWRGHAWRRFVP